MIKAVGIGAGGHVGVMLDVLKMQRVYEPIGLVETDPELVETEKYGLPILSQDKMAEILQRGVKHAFMGVRSTGSTSLRTRIYGQFCKLGFEFIHVIDPRADIAVSAVIGTGATIFQGAIVQSHSQIGENCIINTGAIVEHSCVVGDDVHVATGAMLAGEVVVEDGVHVGIGAVIRQGIRIGEGAVVGAGAVVIRDVRPNTTVAGVPAAEIGMPLGY